MIRVSMGVDDIVDMQAIPRSERFVAVNLAEFWID